MGRRMFLRLLLLLLLALNLGVGGWLLFGRKQPPLPPPTDPGVAELQLLSDQPPAADAPKPGDPAARASGTCMRIGPFDTRSGMNQAFQALMPAVPRIQFHQDQVSRATGWWVYLPAFPTQEEALDKARALAARGISDYYVITAGDHQNTVSLGLFHNPDNARHRFAKVEKLGFHPRLTQRHETLPEYWVDIALPANPRFRWQGYVQAPDVSAHAIDCS